MVRAAGRGMNLDNGGTDPLISRPQTRVDRANEGSPMLKKAPAARLPQVRPGRTNWTSKRRGRVGCRWCSCWLLAPSTARGQERAHPLQPPDRSSPRATLKTFLDSTDAIATFLAQEYLPSPTLARVLALAVLAQTPLGCLDLSNVAPSARRKTGGAAALALYETLSKIDLPAWDDDPRGGARGPVCRHRPRALGYPAHRDHARPRPGRIVRR